MTGERSAPTVAAGPSAATLAALLGADMPAAEDIAPEAFELAERIRDLVEAAVLTDVDGAVRADAARRVAEITEALRAAQRPKDRVVMLVRHGNGRFEHLTQAGSGRLNPQAARMEFFDLPTPPPPGSDPRPVEIRGAVTLTAAHGGPPGRVHGGIVATVLDQLLGVAASLSGPAGFTAGLDLRFRKATPYDVPLELSARFEKREGRKTFVTGEIRAHGEITAQATAVFVSDRSLNAEPAAHS